MKTIVWSNWRVEVYPSEPFGVQKDDSERWHKAMMHELHSLRAEINRHVDHGGSCMAYDTEGVCSHCGHKWTEDSPTYNGGCCDEDEKNKPERIDE